MVYRPGREDLLLVLVLPLTRLLFLPGGNRNTPGSYTFYAACSNTPDCRTATVFKINQPPAAFNVTGGGTFCPPGTGLPVGLSGSEVGVTYQLYKGGVAQGAPVAGTGSAISFGNQLNGTYTVVATGGGSPACPANMTGSVTITNGAVPITTSV